jgi:hypothetical protein
MENFIQSPYLLERDDLIVARVSALNGVGWSDESEPNILGQTVETKPTVAPEPITFDLS